MPFLERTWILEILREKNWSRERLAEESGVNYFRVCEYINGRRTPEIPRAKQLAKALGVAWTLFFEDQAS